VHELDAPEVNVASLLENFGLTDDDGKA